MLTQKIPKNPSRYTKIGKLGLGFFGFFWDFLGFLNFQIGIGFFLGFFGIFWDFLGFFGIFWGEHPPPPPHDGSGLQARTESQLDRISVKVPKELVKPESNVLAVIYKDKSMFQANDQVS